MKVNNENTESLLTKKKEMNLNKSMNQFFSINNTTHSLTL